MNRDGRVKVEALREDDHMNIYISGTAVFVKEFLIPL
jgi:hypothetical protein